MDYTQTSIISSGFFFKIVAFFNHKFLTFFIMQILGFFKLAIFQICININQHFFYKIVRMEKCFVPSKSLWRKTIFIHLNVVQWRKGLQG